MRANCIRRWPVGLTNIQPHLLFCCHFDVARSPSLFTQHKGFSHTVLWHLIKASLCECVWWKIHHSILVASSVGKFISCAWITHFSPKVGRDPGVCPCDMGWMAPRGKTCRTHRAASCRHTAGILNESRLEAMGGSPQSEFMLHLYTVHLPTLESSWSAAGVWVAWG